MAKKNNEDPPKEFKKKPKHKKMEPYNRKKAWKQIIIVLHLIITSTVVNVLMSVNSECNQRIVKKQRFRQSLYLILYITNLKLLVKWWIQST